MRQLLSKPTSRSTRRLHRPVLAAGVILGSLLLGACSEDVPTTDDVVAEATQQVTVEPAPEPVTVDDVEVIEDDVILEEIAVDPTRWPLTGMPTDEVADRPAISVKVGNSPNERSPRRPQLGLENADIVWEQVVEGGITRLVAVYHSDFPANGVAPVRSTRSMDAGINAPYHGILATSGAQPQFLDQVANAGVQLVVSDRGNPGLSRMSSRPAPYNVIGDLDVIAGQANGSREIPPPAQANFAASTEESTPYLTGTDLNELSVRLSGFQTTRWTWDAPSGMFLRSNGAEPSMAESGVRHAATNVVAAEIDWVNDGSMVDGAAPNIAWANGGRALIAIGGRQIEGTWQKAGENQPMRFFDADGNDIEFAPGATWLMLVPSRTGSWSVS